ncbi:MULTISPECIES: cupin domain-containing protein [unclassified Rhizobacter]|uniref:cupin domain-containing protein n=1 Tax=unclassified Rhizobacter TaxID=2640088 RepID=UPI0006FC98A8|nr:MULTISPECIES: cupin domain-containing protein [unclassified Rhizobacter]KQU76779.1 auxin-binding protein [Rhizobacter sp. Root29]KQV97299.1 auxin-binding protein [Rhizobacter sp. Root1238]KRB09971.1 auxin-binding protein [Rhizobacter sp. Root16D2]
MTDLHTPRAEQLRQLLIRNFESAARTHDVREPLYDSMSARLAKGTAALKLGASIDVVAPGKRSCPYHFHYAQEEMFIVLEGEGTLRVAGEHLPLTAGDVVFIPPGPEYPHQIINTSDAPLKYLSISTKDSPEVVEYPDSGKYLATATRDGDPFGFGRMHRADTDLEYWDGEP